MTPTDIQTAIGTLPDKLSDLLEVALDDFEKVTKLPNVKVRMSNWLIKSSGVCHVCLAGSVIANRAGIADLPDYFCPSRFESDELFGQMLALEELRNGQVRKALHHIGVHELPAGCPEQVSVSAREGGPGFIPEMRSLIHLLRTHEL